MSLRNRVWRWLSGGAQPKAEAGYRWPDWLLDTARAQQFSAPDYSLAESQARLYQQLSWVNAAVGAVARSVALQPLRVYQLKGEKRINIDNHEFETLLAHPNPLMSRYEYLYALAAWVKLTGNCYTWLNRIGPKAPPTELWIVPTSRMAPVPDGQLYLRGYNYDPGDGSEILLSVDDVMHLKNFNPSNEWVGASDIEALAWAAEGDWQMARWNTRFFDKDNAKFPGMLTFADNVPDQTWNNIKDELNGRGQSADRSIKALRGVGPGGVQWVQTTVSQKDMEFLAGRTFNRDEIYSVIAPGLASITSVNATEANALAGRATLINQAVWPLCEMIAQKITNDVLPYYGDNLVCEFDDPRVGDRAIELQERTLWQMVHTVAETRDKYDGDKPLGDERDELLVPQVQALGAKIEIDKPGDTPPQLMPFTGQQPQGQQPPEEPPEDDLPDSDVGTEPDIAQAREAEMAKWRRYALKRIGAPGAAFKTEHLPDDVADVIRQRLTLAATDTEVKAAFVGPFLTKANRVTGGGLVDPLGELKDDAERKLARLLQARLNGQFEEVMRLLGDPPNLANLPPDFWETQAGLMLSSIRPQLAQLAAQMATDEIANGIGVSWDLVNAAAVQWAEAYTYTLVRGITDTTARTISDAVTRYYREQGRTVGDLASELEPWFGRVRAERIAVTEITRAAAEGERIIEQEAAAVGMRLEPVWHTSRDELVCTICGPNDDKRRSEGWTVGDIPPAHPNCRCWVTHEWQA